MQLRIRIIHSVFTHIVVTGSAGDHAHFVQQRMPGCEHGGRHVQEVITGQQVGEHVLALLSGGRTGHHRGLGQIVFWNGSGSIEFDCHTAHAFTHVRLAVAIGIHEHKIAHTHRLVEAEVNGQVGVGIGTVIHKGVLASFSSLVHRLHADGQIERYRPDAIGCRIRIINAVFVLIIVDPVIPAVARQ